MAELSEQAKRLARFYRPVMLAPKEGYFRRYKQALSAAAPSCAPRLSKLSKIELALRQPGGACLLELIEITGWRAHSVRGAISGALKKKRGLAVVSELAATGRRYRVGGRE